MATFTEKILVKIDVAADNATKGFKDFRKSVGEAEGATGKLKAGTAALGGIFKSAASSPAAMGGAVAAAGTFALKAVDEFSQLGVEVGNFATATGLSTEESSRWLEVASDLGIESDGLQSILGKLNKNIDPKLFAQYGIEIAKTASGTTDANQTFLNTIERLHAIKDPAERAKVAAKLLGKGWQSAAELIGMSADDIKKRLDGVSDAKVYTPAEVAKAKAFRDAQADLKDVFEDLVITIGQELAPKLSALAKSLSDVAGPMSKLQGASDILGSGFSQITDGIENIGNAWDRFFGDDPPKQLESVGAAAQQAGDYIDFLKGRVQANTDAMKDDEDATKRAKDATHDLAKAIKDLNDIQLDSIATRLDVVTQSMDLMQAQDDYNKSVDDGKRPVSELASAANDLAQKQADLAKQQGIANGHTQTAAERTDILMSKYNDLQKTLEPGSALWNAIEDYKKALLSIPTNVSTRISITGAGAGNAGRLAPGAGQGPDGTATGSVSSGAPTVNVNVRSMPTQRELTEFINTTRRRQGPVI